MKNSLAPECGAMFASGGVLSIPASAECVKCVKTERGNSMF